MTTQTCLEKLKNIEVLDVATVGADGKPQVRNVSAFLFKSDAVYFFTARGKDFCRELLSDGNVQIMGYDAKTFEMIRLSAKVRPVEQESQRQMIDEIFASYPSLSGVYPRDTRYIGLVFKLQSGSIEYFNLSQEPIYREYLLYNGGQIPKKGYTITEQCIGCGKCAKNCPQGCIVAGKQYKIVQNNCLHCGNCFENCPVKAVERL